MFEKLQYYFEFPIVRYAFIVGLLVSLCASLLGVTLVLKRFSFIGDGLSHVAFGAMAIATVTSISNQMLIILPITVISAILILRTGRNTKIRGDASTAMISVGALAVGYMLINLFSKSANVAGDVCSTLFGSTSIITALIIVLAMSLVGSLLISALIIFPSITAMRIFKSFKSVIICSAVISVICAGVGFLISLLCETPVGATIVSANIVVFFLFSIVSKFSGIKK